MEWKEEYSVKVPSIDTQHKRLFALLNKLKSNKEKQDQENSIIKELLDYTLKHFIYEENLLEQNGYAGLDDHREAHDKLTSKVMDLKKQVENEESIDIDALIAFLSDWLVNHILKTDMEYSEFLSQKKVP